MQKGMGFFIFLCLSLMTLNVFAAPKALLLEVDDAISPATQDYIIRGIALAEKQQAEAIILELNTPGGLETAMRGINAAIISSSVPVIAYVAPAGARAASAGTFIMYASHFALMAPGTNIGAASPVDLMANDEEKKSTTLSTSQKKALNDAAAYIRSLAELRGRNIVWAEQAVREGASLSAQEAKKMQVIDAVAENYTEVFQAIDGKQTKVRNTMITMHTKDMTFERSPKDWRYQFLSFLTNPNVAYLLMLIAVYGIFFEFANPGMILPGVAGVIALLLVLYAFQLMPVNYTGLALLVVGIAFIITEFYVSSFGVLGFGGVVAFVLGSILLFDVADPNFQIAWPLIGAMSIITCVFFFIAMSLAIRSHKKAVVTGKEGLIGSEGEVLSVMNEQVIVRVLGEIWEARSQEMLDRGDKVKVVGLDGLTLHVKKLSIPSIK